MLVLVATAGGLAWGQYQDAQRTALGNQRARAVLAGSVIDTYFRGELATLRSIASAPPVVRSDTPAMQRYFERLQRARRTRLQRGPRLDRPQRASPACRPSIAPRRARSNVSDRSYFRHVMATGEPFVSEGITSRLTHKRVIVMAVPTRDARGHLTGVLVGALLLQPFAITKGALDLGRPRPLDPRPQRGVRS